MGADNLGQIDRVLTGAAEHPEPATRVVRRWMETPDGCHGFSRVCSTLGWVVSRQIFDLEGGTEAWERVRAAASEHGQSEDAAAKDLCRFTADLEAEITKGTFFRFFEELDSAAVTSILDDLAPEKLSVLAAYLRTETLEKVFSALPRDLAKKMAVGVARLPRLPSNAIRRVAEPLAEELAGRAKELARLRALIPPPPRLQPQPQPQPQSETPTDSQALDIVRATLRAATEEAPLQRWMQFARAESQELERILSDMPRAESGHA